MPVGGVSPLPFHHVSLRSTPPAPRTCVVPPTAVAFGRLAGTASVFGEPFRHVVPVSPDALKIEMPAAIEFRDSLPKTMIGKLSKKELAAEEAKLAKSG